MNDNTSKEILHSIEKANYLLMESVPQDKWEHRVDMLSKVEIVLDDLVQKQIITLRKANSIRRKMLPLSYLNIIESPNVRDEEKERIKKKLKLLILNENLRRMGFGKDVCIIDC